MQSNIVTTASMFSLVARRLREIQPPRIAVWIGFPVFAAALLVGAYVGFLQLAGNFHVVLPGELYRSAQPSARDLESMTLQYGIKTVVNLRGASTGSKWYDSETATARRLNLTHVDFEMRAGRELLRDQAQQLIRILRDSPKPILIHCKAGADRSGLASALYLAAIAGKGEAAAEGQISLYYGHFSLPISKAYAMDRSFESLEPMLGFFAS